MSYLLIPLLPFAAFITIGLAGPWLKDKSHWVAVPAVFLSLILSIKVFLEVLHSGPLDMSFYTWIGSGTFNVELGFYIDQLTAVMLLLLTSINIEKVNKET